MNDLISRQAAIDAIERLILPQTKGETAAEEINRVAWRCAINCAEEMIAHLPPAEPKNGKWHKRNNANYSPFDGSSEYTFTCGRCSSETDRKTNYCPNCGAKMERSEE